MCPELSQDVSQDHLSRAFYPETFIYDKFDQQNTFFHNHVPNCAPQFKLLDGHAHDAEGSFALNRRSPSAAFGQDVQPSLAIPMGMVGGSHHGQGTFIPVPSDAVETSADYSLHMSCSDNQLMPEIECGWMKDVLDDLLLTSHDMPPLAPLSIGHCHAINLPSLFSPLGLSSKRELPDSPPALTLYPHSSAPQRVTSGSPRPIHLMQTGDHVTGPAPKSPAKTKSLSPTPEPLKIRASKRLRRDEGARKVSKWAQKDNLANVDQVEHVIRERQRRDDMSYKIATLEGLLPQGPKRDRASIVHDSVQYVKSLQQRVEELTKKSAELQLNRISKSSSPVIVSKEEMRIRTSEESPKLFRVVNFHVQVEGGDDAVTVSSCRCSLDFLSITMKALEQLQLDLCRSSITKMPDGAYFCVIASKPRLETSPVPSSSTLALKIKSAVELQD